MKHKIDYYLDYKLLSCQLTYQENYTNYKCYFVAYLSFNTWQVINKMIKNHCSQFNSFFLNSKHIFIVKVTYTPIFLKYKWFI